MHFFPEGINKNRVLSFHRNSTPLKLLSPVYSIVLIRKRLYKHTVLNFTCLTAVNFGFETRTLRFFPKHFQTNYDPLLLSFSKNWCYLGQLLKLANIENDFMCTWRHSGTADCNFYERGIRIPIGKKALHKKLHLQAGM